MGTIDDNFHPYAEFSLDESNLEAFQELLLLMFGNKQIVVAVSRSVNHFDVDVYPRQDVHNISLKPQAKGFHLILIDNGARIVWMLTNAVVHCSGDRVRIRAQEPFEGQWRGSLWLQGESST